MHYLSFDILLMVYNHVEQENRSLCYNKYAPLFMHMLCNSGTFYMNEYAGFKATAKKYLVQRRRQIPHICEPFYLEGYYSANGKMLCGQNIYIVILSISLDTRFTASFIVRQIWYCSHPFIYTIILYSCFHYI